MATVGVGKAAESAVAEELKNLGYQVIDQNWKTPQCEIDIIAKKDSVAYFVEVKYRSTTFQGAGIDYITTAKIKKMNFAARVWCQFNNWTGDWRLAAVSVGSNGLNYLVGDLVELE